MTTQGTAICIFGTASDVGKSTVAAAIGRILSRNNIRVAPFKAQNMSNNAGVVTISTEPESGRAGEIGRAQIVQAEACRVEPETDMNPVLLKPSSDRSSQVVVNGIALGNFEAKKLWQRNGDAQNPLRIASRDSLQRLMQKHEVVVIEGAGSCAEVNLRDRDFVNFETARQSNAAVILVCDIEKGGVFAQVIGTLHCLEEPERSMVKGIIVNKFRGDPTLFDDGRLWIENKTNIPILGVIPYFDPLDMYDDNSRCVLPSEDALYRSSRVDPVMSSNDDDETFSVAVILLPRVANHTDFAPLEAHKDITLDWLRTPRDLSLYSLVIIPGSKSVIADLQWMKEKWSKSIKDYVTRPDKKGILLGICGGYQILGQTISDPFSVDSTSGTSIPVNGLQLLPMITEMTKQKELKKVTATWDTNILLPKNTPLKGYEIHVGRTTGDNQTPIITKSEGVDGCQVEASDNSVNSIPIIGTYLHGLFDHGNADVMFSHMTGKAATEIEEKDPYTALSDHFIKAMGDSSIEKLLSLTKK